MLRRHFWAGVAIITLTVVASIAVVAFQDLRELDYSRQGQISVDSIDGSNAGDATWGSVMIVDYLPRSWIDGLLFKSHSRSTQAGYEALSGLRETRVVGIEKVGTQAVRVSQAFARLAIQFEDSIELVSLLDYSQKTITSAERIQNCEFVLDGRYLLVASESQVQLWDMVDFRVVAAPLEIGKDELVRSARAAASSKHILVQTDRRVSVWAPFPDNHQHWFEPRGQSTPMVAATDPEGTMVAIAYSDGTRAHSVEVYDLSNGVQLSSSRKFSELTAGSYVDDPKAHVRDFEPTRLAFNSLTRQLIAFLRSGDLLLADISSLVSSTVNNDAKELQWHRWDAPRPTKDTKSRIVRADVTLDGNAMLTLSADGRVTRWLWFPLDPERFGLSDGPIMRPWPIDSTRVPQAALGPGGFVLTDKQDHLMVYTTNGGADIYRTFGNGQILRLGHAGDSAGDEGFLASIFSREDGVHLVTVRSPAGNDNPLTIVRFFDLTTMSGATIRAFEPETEFGPGQQPTSWAFSLDGRYFATATPDFQWHPTDGFNEQDGKLSRKQSPPDVDYIVRVYKTSQDNVAAEIRLDSKPQDINLSADGQALVVTIDDQISLYRLSDKGVEPSATRDATGHKCPPTTEACSRWIVLSPDGETALVLAWNQGGEDEDQGRNSASVVKLDEPTGRADNVRILPIDVDRAGLPPIQSRNGWDVFVRLSSGGAGFVDLKNGKFVDFSKHIGANAGAVATAPTLNSRKIVAGYADGRARLIAESGAAIELPPSDPIPLVAVAASPDGRFVVGLKSDASLTFWDTRSKKVMWRKDHFAAERPGPRLETEPATPVRRERARLQFSRDGSLLIVAPSNWPPGGGDSPAILEARTGNLVLGPKNPLLYRMSAEFAHDTLLLVSRTKIVAWAHFPHPKDLRSRLVKALPEGVELINGLEDQEFYAFRRAGLRLRGLLGGPSWQPHEAGPSKAFVPRSPAQTGG